MNQRISSTAVTVVASILAVLPAAHPRLARADASWPGLSSPAPAVGGGRRDAAVVVGLEKYAFVEGVPGAERNAKDWYSYLTGTLGTPPENVRLLLNDEAAKEDILRAARHAAAEAGKDGTLWFVFIGHGAPGGNGKDGLLVGVDARQTANSIEDRGVRQAELFKALKKSQAKRIVVVLDACFSGRGSNGHAIAKGLQPLMVVTAAGALDPRMAVLTAAKGNQFAGPLPGADRPAFSYLVLGGLRGWAGKAELTAKDLWSYAKTALQATLQGRDQTPDIMGTRDLPVARSAGEKAPDLAALAMWAAQAQGSGGGFRISAGDLPAVPSAQAPGSLDAAVGGLNFSNVNVAVLTEYNDAYVLDKNPDAPAADKAAAWEKLASDAPQYADMAKKRAAAWAAFAAQQKVEEAAREKRAEARDADWGKLGALLKLAVVPDSDKRAWAGQFVRAYFKFPGLNPLMAKGLVPYVAAGPTLTALKALAARPMTAAEREQMRRDEERAQKAALLASLNITWVKIPGGSFMMGSNDLSNAQPVHQVSVPSFEMLKTLVTNKQYQACVKAGACTANEDEGQAFDGDDQPVVGADWNQARTFAKWVGGRLPSEAEWEYAARSAGKDYKYPWGNGDPCSHAVISGCGQNNQATAPVCSKPSGNTEQGLCDMAGNAWEWVEDWYHDSYNGAPTDGGAWIDPAGSFRVSRGGSWDYVASFARAAGRDSGVPSYRLYRLGFRVAR